MRRALVIATAVFAATVQRASAAGTAPAPKNATGQVVQGTVDVGRVFQAGGTDGLILYALIFGTILMTFVAVLTVWLAFRSIAAERKTNAEALAKKDQLNHEQTQSFIASADRTAIAIGALAVSTATQTSVQAGQTQVLARMEGTDARLQALLDRLDV
jgi:H+/gluconate symporter-like permease